MAAHGVATITRIAGDNTGTFRDDLTTVGQWPKDVFIVRITRIVVHSGAIIDSVRITYLLSNGTTATEQHGGNGGVVTLDVTLAPNQKVVAVYGRHLNNVSPFGKKNFVQLSFVIVTKGADPKNPPTCEVKTASTGEVVNPNTEFDFSWSLVGAASYTFQPTGKPNAYLQGIAFTEVPSLAAGPF